MTTDGVIVLTVEANIWQLVRLGRVFWVIMLVLCAELIEKDASSGGVGKTFPGSRLINWVPGGLSEGQPGPTANKDG